MPLPVRYVAENLHIWLVQYAGSYRIPLYFTGGNVPAVIQTLAVCEGLPYHPYSSTDIFRHWMPRLDNPLTGTEHELERLRADGMLDGGLFTLRNGKMGEHEEVIAA